VKTEGGAFVVATCARSWHGMKCVIEGCHEEGTHDVGMRVVETTSTGSVETTLLVCVEHGDEFASSDADTRG
jgi:hypothetical protein